MRGVPLGSSEAFPNLCALSAEVCLSFQSGRQGGTIISVFAHPNGIARFFLDGLAADEQRHVIDVIRRQDLADLKRLQTQGRLVSSAEIVAEILLVDSVTAPAPAWMSPI